MYKPAWLSRRRRNWLRHLFDRGDICVVSPDVHFDADYQIEPDAINLRLHPHAMRLSSGAVLDPQAGAKDIEKCFQNVAISNDGLILEPGDILFCRTLETVLIQSERYLGLVLGRRNIAGFGLSIYCDQPKLPSGLPWNFPLQIQNRTANRIKIYPYMYIAQLVLIEYRYPAYRRYEGAYRFRVENYYPLLEHEEQSRIADAVKQAGQLTAESVNTRQTIEAAFHALGEAQGRRRARARSFVSRYGLSPVLNAASFVLATTDATMIVLAIQGAQPWSTALWLTGGTATAFILHRVTR